MRRLGYILTFLMLAGTFVPAQGCGYTCKQDRTTATRTTLSVMTDAVKVYVIDMGAPPVQLQSLVVCPKDLPEEKTWYGPYYVRTTLPRDAWGNELLYEVISADQARIWSAGADQMPDTADDIVSQFNFEVEGA